MNRNFFIGVGLASVIAIFVGFYFASNTGNSAQVKADPEAQAVASATSFDWGEIGLNDGNVEKVFEIKNNGTQPLSLSNVSTSCMCTTAQLSLGDETSPLFGMHTKADYSLKVPPERSAKLKVVFDPAFHGPSGVGPIIRQVMVSTNDPVSRELTFMLTAVVRR